MSTVAITAASTHDSSHSRSCGEACGSSDHAGRRSPRRRATTATAEPTEATQAAGPQLRVQRNFRPQQLQQLRASRPQPVADPATVEVHRVLRDAALSALRDIDSALLRMELGKFGLCTTCAGAISPDRLRVVPMTAVCGRCHRARASHSQHEMSTAARPPSPPAATGSAQDIVDIWGDQSFPASDPPSNW